MERPQTRRGSSDVYPPTSGSDWPSSNSAEANPATMADQPRRPPSNRIPVKSPNFFGKISTFLKMFWQSASGGIPAGIGRMTNRPGSRVGTAVQLAGTATSVRPLTVYNVVIPHWNCGYFFPGEIFIFGFDFCQIPEEECGCDWPADYTARTWRIENGLARTSATPSPGQILL